LIEVELRAKADLAAVEKNLKKLGAKFVGEKHDADQYYSIPGQAPGFSGRLAGKGVARIRVQEWLAGRAKGEKKVFLTVKVLPGESHAVRLESEVQVSDAGSAADVLEALGCKKVLSLDKQRKLYSLDGLAVLLDKVSGLGNFVEVACERKSVNVLAARRNVLSLFGKLGVPAPQVLEDSYYSLALNKTR